MIGVALVANPDPADLLSACVVGNVLVAGAATSVALGSLLLQRVDPKLDDVALTGWAMVVGDGLLHAASAAVGESFPPPPALARAVVGAIAYLGLFATVAAFLVYFSLLRTYGSFQADLISYLMPVVATLTGVVRLNETIDSLAVAGSLIVFVGFAA